jgi:uncharacterized OB-fold protein
MAKQIPVVDYLVLGERPHLISQTCARCGALYFDRRNACAKCFGGEFTTRALANDGTLRAFTFVHRVKRPYVSVIVDLKGGGVVKANLLGVVNPEQITARSTAPRTTHASCTDDTGYRTDGARRAGII